MRKIIQNLPALKLSLLLIVALLWGTSSAQWYYSATETSYSSTAQSVASNATDYDFAVGPGTGILIAVTEGTLYKFTSCKTGTTVTPVGGSSGTYGSTTYDTRITGYKDGEINTPRFFGTTGACGTHAVVEWVADFTGSLRVCSSRGSNGQWQGTGISNSHVLTVRKVAAAALTTPTLTATPVPASDKITLTYKEPSANLVAYYPFEERTGNTVYDFGPNASNGTWYVGSSSTVGGAGYAEGLAKTSLGSTGSAGNFANNFVDIPAGTNFDFGTGAFTYSMWMNGTSFPGLNTLFEVGTHPSNDILFRQNASNLELWVNGSNYINYAFAPAINTWYHVALTRNRTTDRFELFINGYLVQSVSVTSTVSIVPSASGNSNLGAVNKVLRIGASAHAASQLFQGRIDEFRVYNVALSADQIHQIGSQGFRSYTLNKSSVGASSVSLIKGSTESDANFWDIDNFESGVESWSNRDAVTPVVSVTAYTGGQGLSLPSSWGRNFENGSTYEGTQTSGGFNTSTYPFLNMAYKVPSGGIVNMLLYSVTNANWFSVTMTCDNNTSYPYLGSLLTASSSLKPFYTDNQWHYKSIDLREAVGANNVINAVIFWAGTGPCTVPGASGDAFNVDDFSISAYEMYGKPTYDDATVTDVAAPSVPTGVTVTNPAGSSTSLSIDWTAASDNGTTYYYSAAPYDGIGDIGTAGTASAVFTKGLNASAYNLSETGGATTTSGYTSTKPYTFTGLSPNTQYCYAVQARDAAATPNASALSSPVVCKYTRASCVTSFTATANTGICGRIDLSWSGGAWTNVRVRQTSGTPADVYTGSGTSTSLTGLSPNTLYSYQIFVRNGDGLEEAACLTASATTPVLPTITSTGVVAPVCASASAQTTTMPYTATSGSPTSYSISWATLAAQGSTANTFVSGSGNVSNINVPGGTAASGTPYSGTMTITTSNGCSATQSISLIVNSNLSAVSISPTGAQTMCTTGTGSALTVSETNGGAITSRQWGKRSTSGGAITNISGATGSSYTPTGASLGAGTWFVVCTSTPTCGSAITSNEVTVTVNSDLSAVNVTPAGAQTMCTTGSGSALTVAETNGGVITGRQWGKRSTSGGAITNISGATGSSYTPTGASLGAGTWFVVCTSTPTCGSAVTSNEVTVTVNSDLSAVNVTPTGAQTICTTGSGSALTVAETNGGVITGRQWGKRSTSGGAITNISGATGSSYTPTGASLGAGTWFVVCTSTPTCGSAITSNEVTVTVNSNLSAVNVTPAGAQTMCTTGSGSALTVSETNGGAVTGRQWGKRSTSGGAITNISGATGSSYTPTGASLGAGTWFVVCTSTPTCGSAITSNEVTVTVNSDLSAVNVTPTGAQTICTSGSGSALTVAETNGGAITGRQWGKRSISGGAITNISGATGSSYTPTGASLGAGTWFVVCTSTPTCGSAITSNEVTVTVNSNLTAVNVSPTASQSLCSTGTGTALTVTETNGGAISRQWGKRSISGGAITPISGATGTSYTPTGASLGIGSWFIVCTSTPACGSLITSNEVHVTINDDPAITTDPADGSICQGTSYTMHVVATSAMPITYSWQYASPSTPVTNGNPTGVTYTGATTPDLTIAAGPASPPGTTSYWAVLSNGVGCPQVTSLVVSLTINATMPTSVSLADNSSNGNGAAMCDAATIVYTATPTNGGTSPVFDFKVNNVTVQSGASNVYSTSAINNGDAIKVVMTSSEACASPVSPVSNTISATITACGYTWTGAGSDHLWSNPANWNPTVPPNACGSNVFIPLVSNFPTLIANVTIGNVNLQDGAMLDLSSNTMSVCGNWTGGSSTASAVAGSGSVILVGAGAQIMDGKTEFQTLRLNKTTGSTASLQVGSSFDVYTALELQSGEINVTNGSITFKSPSSSQSAVIDNFTSGYNGILTGPVYFERSYDGAPGSYGNHLMGSPLNQLPVSQFGATGGTAGYALPYYNCDETRLDVNSPYTSMARIMESNGASCGMKQTLFINSGNTNNAEGYWVRQNGAGKLTLHGDANLAASYSRNDLSNSGWTPNQSMQNRTMRPGWGAVSNPYAAYLDATLIGAQTNFDNQRKVWITTGPFANSYQDAIGQFAILAPGQAMMVHCNASGATNQVYTLSKNFLTRSPSNTQFYQQANEHTLSITATNLQSGLADITTVAFNNDATVDFDAEYDADKLSGKLNRHTLYTHNADAQHWLSTNVLKSISETSTVPMGIEPGATGNYVLTFEGLNSFDGTSYITLEDLQQHLFYDVRSGDYHFSADSADNWERFVLHFTPAAEVTTTDQQCNTLGTIDVTQQGTSNWNYTLTDNNNTAVSSGTLNSTTPLTANVPSGTYTLTLVDNNNYTVVKTITVNGTQPITADFTPSATSVETNTGITFTSTNANATNYYWDFGDGSTATGQAVTYSYSDTGTYTITLIVVNADGCSSTTSQTVTVTKTATGIGTVSNSSAIGIWANGNRVFIDFSKQTKVDATIEIYNAIGQLLVNVPYSRNAIYSEVFNDRESSYIIVRVRNNGILSVKRLVLIK